MYNVVHLAAKFIHVLIKGKKVKLLYTIMDPSLASLLFWELSVHFLLEMIKSLTVRPPVMGKTRFPCGGQLSDQMSYFKISFLLYILIFLDIGFIAGWSVNQYS